MFIGPENVLTVFFVANSNLFWLISIVDLVIELMKVRSWTFKKRSNITEILGPIDWLIIDHGRSRMIVDITDYGSLGDRRSGSHTPDRSCSP